MNSKFVEYFRQFSFLSFEDIQLLYSLVRVRRVPAGRCIVNAGDLFYSALYVISGLLRSYISSPTGEERTVHLAHEGMVAGCPDCIMGKSLQGPQ